MGRPTNPPEGPERPMPDGYCAICDQEWQGSECPECGRSQEESDAEQAERMDERIDKFLDLLETRDIFNFKEKQIADIWSDGWYIKAIPRFGVKFTSLLELPGVSEVYIDRDDHGDKRDIITIDYDPSEAMSIEERRNALEDIQRLCNRRGARKASRLISIIQRGQNLDHIAHDTQDKLDAKVALRSGFRFQ